MLIRMMLRLDLALQIFSRRSSESPVDEILGFDFLCSRIGRCEVIQNRLKSSGLIASSEENEPNQDLCCSFHRNLPSYSGLNGLQDGLNIRKHWLAPEVLLGGNHPCCLYSNAGWAWNITDTKMPLTALQAEG